MAGGDNSLGYLRQINEKMDRLLSIAERYVGVPTEPAVEPAASAEEVLAAEPAAEPVPAAAAAAGAGAPYVIPRRGNGRPPPAFAQSLQIRSVPIQRSSAQGFARMLRRTLEKGVEASEKPKIEKQIRDLQPKINAEIAAGIPIESEFQGQYDAAVLYLTRDLKPEMRAKMERVRNDLKVKLNAEKEHGIARGGSKKRKTRKRQIRSRRN